MNDADRILGVGPVEFAREAARVSSATERIEVDNRLEAYALIVFAKAFGGRFERTTVFGGEGDRTVYIPDEVRGD